MSAPKIKRGRVRNLATIYLANVANFFHARCRPTDLRVGHSTLSYRVRYGPRKSFRGVLLRDLPRYRP